MSYAPPFSYYEDIAKHLPPDLAQRTVSPRGVDLPMGLSAIVPVDGYKEVNGIKEIERFKIRSIDVLSTETLTTEMLRKLREQLEQELFTGTGIPAELMKEELKGPRP